MNKAILVLAVLFGLSANAAQTAKVVIEIANVLDKPQPDATVIGTVAKDTSIAVSNVATNGYYKSRIPSGTIGWISGADILTASAPVAPEATPAPVAQAKPQATPAPAPKKKKKEESLTDHSRIIISGGMQILNNSGFPTGMSNANSKTGFGGTFEMQFKLSEQFYWGGRLEYFTSSSTPTATQALSFHTMPLMVGAMWVPLSKPDFRLGVGLYGGVSLLTSLAATNSSGTATFTSADLCYYGNLQGSYTLTSSMSLYSEVGYRIHTASYPASPDSLVLPAFKPDFGGLVMRLGLEFRL